MTPLDQQFVTEARELIDRATDDLIALERDGAATDRIERVFRAFHTLKGSAGIIDLPAMSLTLHAAEDVLAAMQAGHLAVTSAVIDGTLACLEQISRWVDDFEATGSLPVGAAEEARATVATLRALPSGEPPQSTTAATGAGDSGKISLPDWLVRLLDAQRPRIASVPTDGAAQLRAILYEPRRSCFFDGDDPLALMRQIPHLLAFHVEAREPWPPLAELDPYACNLRLQALATAGRDALSRLFRLVPDEVQIVDVPREVLVAAVADRGHPDGSPRSASAETETSTAGLVLAVVEEQRRVLRVLDGGEDFVGRVGAAARVAANACRHASRADLALRIESARAAAIDGHDVAPLVAVLDEMIEAWRLRPAAAADEAFVQPATTAEQTRRAGAGSLRVDEAKIDALMNLAGELIVVKNGFAHLSKQIEREDAGRGLVRAVRREYDALERLVGEMHAAIVHLRMVPIAQAFRRFPPLVRDLARRLGKKARLVMAGETTEVDKAVVDRLFEPLLHLVRNALDHGIESPLDRLSAGKPEVATLTLRASRVGNRIVVEVGDDGRGIDPAMVRRKARERGLLADDAAALTDEQAIDLIFSAGFSTAAEVSDISGRGIGMHVVRTHVEQIGGRVSLAGKVGAGTTIRLDLPVTIALSSVMVVEAGGQRFGIPMDAVTETVRLAPDRIVQIRNNEGFVLRDRVVPICSLAGLMNLPPRAAPRPAARLLVVTELAGYVAAIEVDALRDRLEVVLKPMQGLLGNAQLYSGTTLLGDGTVLLVLNLKEILP